MYVCMCVYLCVLPKPVLRGPPCLTYLYCEVIWYSEVRLPRSGLIFTLHGRIAFRSSLAKFGLGPRNICFILPAFKSALKTSDCSANGGTVVTPGIMTSSTRLQPGSLTQFESVSASTEEGPRNTRFART